MLGFVQGLTAVGVMVQQTALNNLGEVVVAAYTAANKIDLLATLTLLSIGSAVATYCGQNYGAGEFGRIREGVKKSMILTVGFALFGAALVILLGNVLTHAFIADVSQEILDYSHQFLIVQGCFYITLGVIFVYRNALQGIGRSALTMVAGAIELVMRVLAEFLLARAFGFLGICFSNPAAWVGADVFLLIAYYVIIRKYKDAPKEENQEEKDRTSE